MSDTPDPSEGNGSQGIDQLQTDVPLSPLAENYANTREPHPSADMGTPSGASSNPAQWVGMARWRPGGAYLHFLADCENPATMPPHERFNAAVAKHPRVAWWAIVLDCLFVTLVVAGVLFGVGYTFYAAFIK